MAFCGASKVLKFRGNIYVASLLAQADGMMPFTVTLTIRRNSANGGPSDRINQALGQRVSRRYAQWYWYRTWRCFTELRHYLRRRRTLQNVFVAHYDRHYGLILHRLLRLFVQEVLWRWRNPLVPLSIQTGETDTEEV